MTRCDFNTNPDAVNCIGRLHFNHDVVGSAALAVPQTTPSGVGNNLYFEKLVNNSVFVHLGSKQYYGIIEDKFCGL